MSDLVERLRGSIIDTSYGKGLSMGIGVEDVEEAAAELTRLTELVKELEARTRHADETSSITIKQRERVERNRDMWKGQCGRQAEQLTSLLANLARAVEVLQFAIDGYANHDVNHVDYRVKVYAAAVDCLEEMGK